MSDLIDRQAAIDVLNEYFARIGKLKRRGLNKGEKAISLDTVGAIKTLPPAEPEQKKGRWNQIISIPNDMYGRHYCSECGKEGNPFWYFCPNCGADMREGESE